MTFRAVWEFEINDNPPQATRLKTPGYPIELDLRGRRVVVVGLGPVGRRKASSLVEAEAQVVGVDPDAVEVPAGVARVLEAYRPDHLVGASLVFAAATPEVNRQVVIDARHQGIWVNSASDPDSGNFAIPAIWRDRWLTATVSTSGASPALASTLRDRVASCLGPTAAGLVALLAELRPEVLANLDDPSDRRRVLSRLADPRWLDLFDQEGPEATRLALRSTLGLSADPPRAS